MSSSQTKEMPKTFEHVFHWMAHRLRLLGGFSLSSAMDVFGVSDRQVKRWARAYRTWCAPRPEPGLSELQAGRYRSTPSGHLDALDVGPLRPDCVVATPDILRLLDVLRGHSLVATGAPRAADAANFQLRPATAATSSALVVEVGLQAHPRLDGPDACLLIQAICEKSCVLFEYLTQQGARKTILCSPHRLLFAGSVYHFRGADHADGRIKNYNLARVFACQAATDVVPIGHDKDTEWTAPLTIEAFLHSDLDSDEIAAMRRTYPIDEDGRIVIKTTRALVHFVRQDLMARTVRRRDGSVLPVFERCCTPAHTVWQ